MVRFTTQSSSRIAALFSWLHGTRFELSGSGNTVEKQNAILRDTKVEIRGNNSRLIFGPNVRLWGCSISLIGDNVELRIGGGCNFRHSRFAIEDTGSRLRIGANTSMTGATVVSQEGQLLELGEDCMVAQHAELRNTDSHAIYADADYTKPINEARDVMIGNHVWIGLGACVFKGATIGDGAVIGARSIVLGNIPAACMAYGIPATQRRAQIAWSRRRHCAHINPRHSQGTRSPQ